jgi:hypothetical protein
MRDRLHNALLGMKHLPPGVQGRVAPGCMKEL